MSGPGAVLGGALSLTVIGHWGAYPGPGEACSCYLVEAGGAKLLLDCGSGALSLLQSRIGLSEVDAVVLSHYHADHTADLGSIQYAARIEMDLKLRTRPLRVFGHGLDPACERLGYHEFALGTVYGAGSKLETGPFGLEFFPTVHPDPNFAIRLSWKGKSIVYTGDTGPCPGLEGFCAGADLLVCETSLYDEYAGRIPGHLSAGEAGELARAAGAKTLLATHLPHWGEHALLERQARAAFGGETILARSGLSLEL